jgi:hypothetical protein
LFRRRATGENGVFEVLTAFCPGQNNLYAISAQLFFQPLYLTGINQKNLLRIELFSLKSVRQPYP